VQTPHPIGLLALGYNDQGDERLRFAEAEARHIARQLNGAALVGPAPKSEPLIAAGQQARWLHIAGHAVFKPEDPLSSELRLGAGDSLSARTIMQRLDLRVDLVTLSACTSGLSHVVPGDELLGLQRALLYAGAPTVVCTLWEAADMVALLIMERFYAGLLAGQSPAAALRAAQVAVREMSGRELAEILRRWRTESADAIGAADELPVVSPDQYDIRPFSEPLYWATFMLIGRA
jgi:CHAT domain-containing protein